MDRNLTICNNCAGVITLPVAGALGNYLVVRGLNFCCRACADHYNSPDNTEPDPIGLAYDLGLDCTDF